MRHEKMHAVCRGGRPYRQGWAGQGRPGSTLGRVEQPLRVCVCVCVIDEEAAPPHTHTHTHTRTAA